MNRARFRISPQTSLQRMRRQPEAAGMRLLQDTLHCVMLVRVREEFTSCWEVEEEEEEEVVWSMPVLWAHLLLTRHFVEKKKLLFSLSCPWQTVASPGLPSSYFIFWLLLLNPRIILTWLYAMFWQLRSDTTPVSYKSTTVAAVMMANVNDLQVSSAEYVFTKTITLSTIFSYSHLKHHGFQSHTIFESQWWNLSLCLAGIKKVNIFGYGPWWRPLISFSADILNTFER